MQPNFSIELLPLGLVIVVLLVPFWKLFSRMGFPGWMSLAMVVPIVNLILLYYVAFARWPVSQRTVQRDTSA